VEKPLFARQGFRIRFPGKLGWKPALRALTAATWPAKRMRHRKT